MLNATCLTLSRPQLSNSITCARQHTVLCQQFIACTDSQEAYLPVCYNLWWTSCVAGSIADHMYCSSTVTPQCMHRGLITRSSLDIGVSVSFLWFAKMLVTSHEHEHERDSLTRIGRRFLFVYFPRLTQLRIELEGIDGSAFCITFVTSSISLVIRVCLVEPSGHSFIP